MVLGRDSRKKWGKWDFLLAKAFQRYQDEMCPQCHMPVYICHNDDNRIEFKVVKETCFATAQIEQVQEQNSKAKKKMEPGTRYVPEPKIISLTDDEDLQDDTDLSDFRRPYYQALAIRRGLIPPVDSDQD